MAACRGWCAALLAAPAVGPVAALRCPPPAVVDVEVEEDPNASWSLEHFGYIPHVCYF